MVAILQATSVAALPATMSAALQVAMSISPQAKMSTALQATLAALLQPKSRVPIPVTLLRRIYLMLNRRTALMLHRQTILKLLRRPILKLPRRKILMRHRPTISPATTTPGPALQTTIMTLLPSTSPKATLMTSQATMVPLGQILLGTPNPLLKRHQVTTRSLILEMVRMYIISLLLVREKVTPSMNRTLIQGTMRSHLASPTPWPVSRRAQHPASTTQWSRRLGKR
ncbi:hypothetical protein BU23DRAFT_258975 [Bimuria novae-zelandiae CBS 107.79]|uniref:Uncharacterized protein n=1 Tax=Bimuria novae-zelandiae CBS 107.79 TaxID=1447943 RepID=A0A6A5UVN1_9PLEO|nr:hypothetical protein BU23DRAFT_258975 [Bimuria novae-zelandiae CBS 107.79]